MRNGLIAKEKAAGCIRSSLVALMLSLFLLLSSELRAQLVPSAVNSGPICVGGEVTLSENGTGAVSWSWSSDGSATFSDPAAQNTIAYNAVDGELFTVVVKDVDGNEDFAATAVKVSADPVILTDPVSPAAACIGGAISDLTVTAEGGVPELTYQWYFNTTGSTTTGTPVGINSSSYTPSTSDEGISYYYCVVSASGNGCGSAVSAAASVTVIPDMSIGSVTGDSPLCTGGTASYTFSSVNLGGSGVGSWSSSVPSVAMVDANGLVTGVGAGSCNIVYTVSGGCGENVSAQQTITINPDAVITLTSAAGTVNQSRCINTAIENITYSVTGGGTGAVAEGLPEGVNGVFSSGIFSISGIPSEQGRFDYTVTTTGTCQQKTLAGTITVNPLPTATISGGAEVCQGGASPEIVFTGNSGTLPYTFTYLYNGSSLRTILSAPGSNTATFQVSTSTATTYTFDLISVKDGSSTACTQNQSGTAVVIVNQSPTASITGTATVCENSASPLITFTGASGTVPYTFIYTINSGDYLTVTTLNSNNAVTVPVPTDVAGIYTYSLVSITDASPTACTRTVTGGATVTVNQLPAIPTVGTITFPTCTLSTGSVRLTGMPSGGSWTLTQNPGSLTSTGSGTSTTISGLEPGTYTYTVTNSKGCTSLPTEDILIPEQPFIPQLVITNPPAVCSPSTVNITEDYITEGSPAGLTYTYWINSSATTLYQTPAAATAGTYYIKGTNIQGCYDIEPVVVTVNQTPAANAGSGGDECDLSYNFKAVSSIGAGSWSLTSGPGTVVFSPSETAPTATATVSAYGTYVFTWSEVNGECSNSSSITVSFYEQPVVSAGSGGSNCGLEFYLSATNNIGIGTWTYVSGPGSAVFSPDANAPDALVTVSNYGSYSFRWTVVNGSCSATATVTVKFVEQPSADAGSDGSECDLSFALNAVQGAGTTGSWKLINGPGSASFSPSLNDPDAVVTVDVVGTYSFGWTEVNSVCKSTDVVSVVFHPVPSVSAGEDINICEGTSTSLEGLGRGSFRWEPDSLVNDPGLYNPVATPLETTTFKVTLTDQYGCVNSDEVQVSVWAQPVAYAGGDIILDYLFFVTLGAQLGLNETGNWSIVSGSGVFDDSTDPSTAISGLSVNKNELRWTVTNGVCPESSDTVTVTVKDLLVPTLITPNGDNINEYLVLKGLEALGKTELIVFDRRGAIVYENKDYNNDWNGTDNSGKELPDDTYFIVLKAGNGKSLSNYIVIRR